MKRHLRPGSPTRRTRIALGALVALVATFSPKLCVANPPRDSSPAHFSWSLDGLLGEQLTASEMTSIKGTVDWLLTSAEMDIVAAAFAPSGNRLSLTEEEKATADEEADPAMDIRTMLAMFEGAGSSAGETSERPQLALLDTFPASNSLTNRLMQFQGAAAFDTSVRFLCSDKIYADLYPGGTGWNDHAYDGCGPQQPGEPARVSDIRPLVFTRTDGPAEGDIATILPCGGSLVNNETMTIAYQGNSPNSMLGFARPGAVTLADAAPLHGGFHW